MLPVVIVLCLTCCATTKQELVHIDKNNECVLLQNKAVTKIILLTQYEEWKGTKYKYGGSSKEGIDCSGFIQLTFLAKFGIELPRQSINQGKVGYDIPTCLLQSGDLVFFKVGIKTNHVGIYIDNGEFMHVSKSLGVTISSLSDSYWHRRFWKVRRISI